MAATTLNSGDPAETFDVTAGALYVLAASGSFDGCVLKLEYALAGTPAVFEYVPDGFLYRETALEFRSPGTKLRVSIQSATAATSINFEVTAAA